MKNNKVYKTFLLGFIISFSSHALYASEFVVPPKRDAFGKKISPPRRFESQEITSGSFVEKKKKYQKAIMDRGYKSSDGKWSIFSSSEFLQNELEYFLQKAATDIVQNLEIMRDQKLNQGRVSQQPWSDTYWPYYKGAVAARYADEKFESYGQNSFKRYYAFVQQPENSFPEFITAATDAHDPRLLTLSPAEKYDLLVGDENATLSKKMWGDALSYADEKQEVERWMGLCHGWAPASYSDLRPRKTVYLHDASGKKDLTFFPSDIKGLTTTLWAYAKSSTLFMGGRCNLKNPPPDSDGRISDPDCWDMHPGIWHAAVINRIGVEKKSFVMDATWDYEVWNQPILSYRVQYLNPITRKSSADFDAVAVSVANYPQDRFKKYRNTKTAKIVAVSMRLDYMSETEPSHSASDAEANDIVVGVIYNYDLELDASNNIIGGEWQDFAHPDFLWTPQENSLAWADGDLRLREDWNGRTPVPSSYKKAAIASSDVGQPLGKIVRKLLEMAQ